MRIQFSASHKYPANIHSVSAAMVHDNIVKGLGELGHEVYYRLEGGWDHKLPEGVIYTERDRTDVDILHMNLNTKTYVQAPLLLPWIRTIHIDIRYFGFSLDLAQDNWVHISKTMCKLFGSNRFVYNGIDPAEFIYSEQKGNYLLFVGTGFPRTKLKGIEIAFAVAKKTGMELRVAGTPGDAQEQIDFENLCKENGAVYLGKITGMRKAELMAGAKAVLFPTQMNEAFGLVITEALMSGTPVIASNKGACSEILTPETGFVCDTEADYVKAVEQIHTIRPADCRHHAMENFTYLKMAEGYVREYEKELHLRDSGVENIPFFRNTKLE